MNEHPIKAAIRQLAAERPHHIDPNGQAGANCQYYEDGQPSCIVGHAIDRLYPGRFDQRWDESPTPAGLVLAELDDSISPEDMHWVDIIQELQDDGASWGEAVEYADIHS